MHVMHTSLMSEIRERMDGECPVTVILCQLENAYLGVLALFSGVEKDANEIMSHWGK